MTNKVKKTISLLLILAVFITSLTAPQPVYARVSFNRFFRTVARSARAIGRGSRFVINLPTKATRWMGPVLGPVAATILTKNIAKNPRWSKLWRDAGRANRAFQTLEEREKYLAELRKMYHGQAVELRQQANQIRESRRNLLNQLTTGDLTYEQYRDNVVALDDLAQVYEKTADKFDQSAEKMRAEDIARIFSRDMLNQVWGQVRDAVVFETAKELEKVIDPDIVQRLLSREANFNIVIDALTNAQIKKILGESDFDDIDVDALRNRVKDSIKEILSENKDAFKKGWKEKVNEIIQKMITKLEEEKSNLSTVKTEATPSAVVTAGEDGDELNDMDKEIKQISEDYDCRNGYTWDKKVGKCKQKNCYDEAIKHAHWSYTLDCVCGSSGSVEENPDDPNKECTYPPDHEACPGCVYACVGLSDECPAAPTNQ